jgi:hypothetical protein
VSRRWWLSWYEPIDSSGDARPRSWPLPAAIPAYWRSGETEDAAILCALVDAPTAADAWELVERAWGMHAGGRLRRWRFQSGRKNQVGVQVGVLPEGAVKMVGKQPGSWEEPPRFELGMEVLQTCLRTSVAHFRQRLAVASTR